MRIVFVDTELRIPIEDTPGGWFAASHGEAGMSAAVTVAQTFVLGKGLPNPEIELWDDHDIDGLAMYLEEADLVVTFNGELFDLRLIAALRGRPLELKAQYDICKAVQKVTGTRKGYRFNDICLRTLGREKTGSGAQAPMLAQQGRWARLFSYCMNDTLLTRDLFWHIVTHGMIEGVTGPVTIDKPIWRGNGEEEAFQASGNPQPGVQPEST